MENGSLESDDENDQHYDIFKQETVPIEVVEENHQKIAPPALPDHPPESPKVFSLKRFALWLLVGLVIIAAIIGGVVVLKHDTSQQKTNVTINTQSLDNGTLNRLTAQAGSQTKQQLTIDPDTIFSHSVTIQGAAEVKGDLTVDGAVKLGSTLSVANNTAVGGNLSVGGQISANSLSVGSISIGSVTVGQDIVLGGHLSPNGSAPTVKASVASAGGTATVTGNDTAGTVTITMGQGSLNSGEMAIVTFHNPFNTTPKVQLTPINDASSELRYYATRSASFFTIDTSSAPVAGASYVFDYFVTQ